MWLPTCNSAVYCIGMLYLHNDIFMVALRNRADNYIFILWFLSILFFSSRPNTGCLPYFHKWCDLSANLDCRSETCCTRLAENAGPKKSPKIAIWAPSHNFVGLYYIFATRHVSTIGKNLLSSNMSSRCPHNMGIGPLTAEICWRVWGTAANFNEFRVLAALLHGSQVVRVSQTLRR